MRRILPVLAVLVLASTGAAQGPTVNLQTDVLTTDPVPLQSGEDGDLSFRVRNTGTTEATDLNITIVDTYPFSLKPDRRRSYSIGELNPGESYYVSTELLVAEDAPDGSNDIRIQLDSGQGDLTRNLALEVQSQEIQLDVTGLKTEPSDLGPDTSDASLIAEVANNGDKEAENAVMQIAMPEGFEITSSFSTRQSLGNIAPGEVKEAEFVFDVSEDASSGEKTIPANLSYSPGDTTGRVTVDRSFDLYLRGIPQFEVTDFQGNLERGGDGTLTIEFRNTGDEESGSTRVRVLESGDQPFTYSSASDFVGTLEPGQEAAASFEVSADSDAEIREYLVDFEFRGVKDTEVFVDDTTQRVQVKGSPGGGSGPGTAVLAGIGVLLLVLAGGVYYFRNRIASRVEEFRS